MWTELGVFHEVVGATSFDPVDADGDNHGEIVVTSSFKGARINEENGIGDKIDTGDTKKIGGVRADGIVDLIWIEEEINHWIGTGQENNHKEEGRRGKRE